MASLPLARGLRSNITLAVTIFTAIALTGCGGPAADPGGSDGRSPPAAVALATAAPEELLDYVRSLVRKRAELNAASTGLLKTTALLEPLALASDASAGGSASASSTQAQDSHGLGSGGTTVQEAGVDEPDLLKATADGSQIWALRPAGWDGSAWRGDQLHPFERKTDGTLSAAAAIELPQDLASGSGAGGKAASSSLRGLLIAPDATRAVVISDQNQWRWPSQPDCAPGVVCIQPAMIWWPTTPQTRLQWLEASAASQALSSSSPSPSPAPVVLREQMVIDGRLIGARRIGRHMYLVVSHSPALPVEAQWASAQSEAERAALLQSIDLSQVLPKVSIDGGPAQPAVAADACHLQTANQSSDLAVTVVLAFDLLDRSNQWTARCFVGGTEALYMSRNSLYLATRRYPVSELNGRLVHSADARTDIHRFAVAGGAVDYVGSGEIAGHLGWDPARASYRMSEHNGDLRVLSFTGQSGWASLNDANAAGVSASPASLSVLRADSAGSGRLITVARLPNERRPAPLGQPGEQLYGVRFDAQRAFLVTFRQVDPLYVLDLGDPLDPKIAGELKIPGFSDYLYPLPGDLLLGIGKDASDTGLLGGVKIGLFDIRQPAAPTQRGGMTLGSRGSTSGLDFSPYGVSLYGDNTLIRGALTVSLVQADPYVPLRGLQRFEVDLISRALLERGVEQSPAASPVGDPLGWDRSLYLSGDEYYWSGGRMTGGMR